MKKLFISLFILLLLTTLIGCNSSEKASEKALENAIGENVDIEIDGEKYTVEYGDGSTIEVGTTEWPIDGPSIKLPKLNKGKITSVIKIDDSCSITIEAISKKDFDDYFEEVKNAGFNEEAMTLTDGDNGLFYSANTIDGYTVSLTYTSEEQTLSMLCAKLENQE